MNKSLIYLSIFVGGSIGSYVPVLFGAGIFSLWSILGGAIGAFAGLWVTYRFGPEI